MDMRGRGSKPIVNIPTKRDRHVVIKNAVKTHAFNTQIVMSHSNVLTNKDITGWKFYCKIKQIKGREPAASLHAVSARRAHCRHIAPNNVAKVALEP